MKKIFFICFLTLMCASCDEDEWVDVTVMPEETVGGAQTFGCLVDGWLYVGGRYSDPGFYGSTPSINFICNADKTKVAVKVKVRKYEYITFTINNPKAGEQCTFTEAKHILEPESGTGASNTIDLGSGIVEITRFDDTIISGRFGSDTGKPISHGRFDVKYVIK